LEEDGLVLDELGDAAFADVDAGLRREDDIHEGNALEFVQHSAGFVAETRMAAPLEKRFP